jgi:molybdopterin-binding protein
LKLTSTITRQAIDELQLTQGDQVTAFFKASEVINVHRKWSIFAF